MVADRKALLAVELIQDLANKRNHQNQHWCQYAPERQPRQFCDNRHAQGERPGHSNKAYRLLGKVPESTLVGHYRYIIESAIAKEPVIPERRVASVVVIGLLMNSGTEGRCENDAPARHEYTRNLANDRYGLRNVLKHLGAQDHVKALSRHGNRGSITD